MQLSEYLQRRDSFMVTEAAAILIEHRLDCGLLMDVFEECMTRGYARWSEIIDPAIAAAVKATIIVMPERTD